MKTAQLIQIDVDKRVEKAIYESFELYISKVASGFYSITVEAPMQLHVMRLIDQKLQETTLEKDERFIVDLEKNIPLREKKDEIDGVIEYYKNGINLYTYLIEFKYKKPRDGGPNSSNIDCYTDIFELEQQCINNHERFKIKKCYFIFMTSDKKYTIPGNQPNANRMVFPLHDGYKIETRDYVPEVPAAISQLKGNGYERLHFENNYNIEYSNFSTSETDYYYFILEIAKGNTV